MARPQTRTQYYALEGGLDVVTPALTIKPGRALSMVNFEPWYEGGYRRIAGYERFDGRPKPSAATFTGFGVNDATGIAVGDILTGSISSSTGVVVGISGNNIAVTKVTGSGFVINDVLTGAIHSLKLVPTGNATGDIANLTSNEFTNIDETVVSADGFVNASVENLWIGTAPAKVTWPIKDLSVNANTLNSWSIRTRARVLRSGIETDDLVTFTLKTTVGAEAKSVTYTQADAGSGYIDRTATQAVSAEVAADINAASIILEQTTFTQNGAAPDGLSIEVDAIEIEVNYDISATINTTPGAKNAPTQDLLNQWLLASENEYRTDIAVVPGVNQVRGVWQRLGDVYAIRDNAGATAGILHKASATGWTTTGVTMAETIRFDAALAAGANVSEGDTLTGLASGATGTIHRIVLHGGSNAWDGSGNGYFVLTGVAGGPFQDNEALQSPALTNIATANGANSTFAFSAGGNYRFVNHNFFGSSTSYRAYGCNGLDPAFEIDAAGVVSPILLPTVPVTGQVAPSVNKPFLIEEHRNHLFLAFVGGSMQHSVVGEPLIWSAFLGAAEFGLGDELTAMNSVVGNVLTVSTTRETRGLFGTNVSDWNLRLVAEQSGSVLFGSQKVDTIYSLDDLGITSLSRTDAFGDFVGATVSQKIQPLVIKNKANFTDSTIVRESNQFRLYFSDKTAIIMYAPTGSQQANAYGRLKRIEFGTLLFPIVVSQIYNTDDQTGKERTYFATNDATLQGFVYEDQIGKNFDGAKIAAHIRTAYNQIKSPTYRKRFRRADLELNTFQQTDIRFISHLTYGAVSGSNEDITANAAGGFWDEANWDQFVWDGQDITTVRGELRGTGQNIGFTIFNDTAFADPWTMQGLTLHFDLRRLQR